LINYLKVEVVCHPVDEVTFLTQLILVTFIFQLIGM